MKNVLFKFRFLSMAVSCIMAQHPATAQTRYSLAAAIDTAWVNSPQLKPIYLNIAAAKADIVTARTRPNPKLNNQTLLMASTSRFEPGTKWTSSDNRQVWWQLTKTVQWHGQRKLKIETANSEVSVSQEIYEEQVRNLSFEVGKSWLACWVLKNKLSLLTEVKSNLDSLILKSSDSFRKKANPQTDVSRAQLLLEQYALEENVTLQDYNNELQNLKLLIGTSDNIIIAEGTPLNLDTKMGTMDSLVSQSLRQRSDVRLAKATIVSRSLHSRYQKAMIWPQPELGVIYNPQNSVPYMGIFATIDLPFFDRNQGERKKAKVLEEQARQELSSTLLQVQTDVSKSYSTYEQQKKNIGRYKGITGQSALILQDIMKRYLRGQTNIVDLLDAQRNWYDTRLLFVQAQQSYYQSYLQLLYNSGLISSL